MLSSTKTTLWGILLLCIIYYTKADFTEDDKRRNIHIIWKKREYYNPDLLKAEQIETITSSLISSLSPSTLPEPSIKKIRRRRISRRKRNIKPFNTEDTSTDTDTDSEAVCGNGRREKREKCDGGPCCNEDCTFKPANTTCGDTVRGICDLPDFCSGASGECHDNTRSQAYICNTSPCTVCGDSNSDCPVTGESTCQGVGECDIDNGDCDYRVTCSVEGGEKICGECPLGTRGNGLKCYSLCGDGVCDPTIQENCVSCPQDCTADYCDKCGDDKCDANENCTNCSADCGPCVATECEEDCSEHGTCNNGLCICESSWTGSACNRQTTEPIIISMNKTNPGLSLQSPIIAERELDFRKFTISVKSLTEFSSNGNSLRSIHIPALNFSLSEDYQGVNKRMNYTANLQNGAIVQIIMWQYEENTKVEFAKVMSEFQKHTLKINVNVQHWPFYNLTNYLGIVMSNDLMDRNNVRVNADDEILNSGNNKIDDTGNLRWLKLRFKYGQFLNKAVVDGRIRTISYSLVNNSVMAIIPHFWEYAEMDPNFNVLVDGADTKSGGGGVSTETIIIAVCASVGGMVILVAAIIFTNRLVTRWQVRKKQKDLRANEKELDKQPQVVIEGMIPMSGLPKSNSARNVPSKSNSVRNVPLNNKEQSINAMGTYVVRL